MQLPVTFYVERLLKLQRLGLLKVLYQGGNGRSHVGVLLALAGEGVRKVDEADDHARLLRSPARKAGTASELSIPQGARQLLLRALWHASDPRLGRPGGRGRVEV